MLREISDLMLRLLFFGTAPSVLLFIAMLFPVTGAVLQIGLALIICVAGEAARRLAQRWPALGALLSRELQFEAYYREHPPRPFVYYVFYPFLFPYWLTVKDARREFLLFKGYTLISFGLLLASLIFQYFFAFPPQLGWRDFAPLALGSLLAETVVVLMFLMPIVTSVVHFHRQHARRRLVLLLLAALLSLGSAAVRLERRRDPIVSYATRVRVRLRSQARPEEASAAQAHALEAAWRTIPGHLDDIARDGKVQAQPLAAARIELEHFYKLDEANAFDLWYRDRDGQRILVLYFESHRGHAPIWLALDQTGALTQDARRLPEGAFRAMRHASR